MDSLTVKYRQLLTGVSTDFKRGLSDKISWESRGICIEGARGTGKSTLMLQYIKENLPLNKSLYVSLDDLYFREHNLVEVAETFFKLGGRNLFIDEAHKYPDWQTAVKNIYDFMPDMKLVVSGSSILALQRSRADLSRRLLRYHLTELSFREFLMLKHQIQVPLLPLEELLKRHTEIAGEIRSLLTSPLVYFKEYLSFGAYPFFMEGEGVFFVRLNQLINVIIDYDLPEAKAIEVSTQSQLKKLLYIISKAVPFQPNITRLAEQTGTTRARLGEMLHVLEEAQMIRNLRSGVHGVSLLNKPDKIFLNNTSLISALAENQPDKGNLRETFFMSQLQNSGAIVTHPKKGDFLINNKYLFEIGGKTKSKIQIKDLGDAFIAVDDIEIGWQKKIPLWLFGFLY